MLVDIIFPGWIPFMNLALAKDVKGFVAAHQQTLNYPFESFIGGHLTRLGTRDDVKTQMAYVEDIKANAGKALKTVDLVAIAKTCADATLAKWKDRLGGAEVWTQSHCLTMAESLRID
jgi:hypothetical protein